jgi:hypothetical protein
MRRKNTCLSRQGIIIPLAISREANIAELRALNGPLMLFYTS